MLSNVKPTMLGPKSRTKSKSKSRSKSNSSSKSSHSSRRKTPRTKTRFSTRKMPKRLYMTRTASQTKSTFGIETNLVKQYFDNYTQFHYVVPPIRAMGAPSENGFVKEINYRHNQYSTNSIFKSSADEMADNLVYEYMVGMEVNKWVKYFPCFIETYGLYKYKTPEEYEYIKRTKLIRDTERLKDSIHLVASSNLPEPKYNYADMCDNSKYYAILIQYIKNAKDMEYMQDKLNNEDTHAILSQVYFALGQLTNDFIHYDLHTNNVLLYEPFPGKYIEFHYHFPNSNVVSFKSKYIAKIIDYGRSYIKSSPAIHAKICKTEACEPRCGWGYGFNWMTTEEETGESEYYISSMLHNPSADLRFFNNVYPNFDMVQFGVGIEDEDGKMYGTEPNPERGFPNQINNVSDASEYLQQFMKDGDMVEYYSKWPVSKKAADINIYVNMSKPMKITVV